MKLRVRVGGDSSIILVFGFYINILNFIGYNQTIDTWMISLSIHNDRGSMHRQEIINLIVQRIIECNKLSRASFSPVGLDIQRQYK